MREHKYRGKDLTGEWRVGSLVTYKVGDNICAIIFTDDKSGRDDCLTKYEVDPETVDEYTGLKDRKGTEIYEGDVLRYMSNNPENPFDPNVDICPIVWKKGAFFFGDEYLEVVSDDPDDFEVIGNIHDQPFEGT